MRHEGSAPAVWVGGHPAGTALSLIESLCARPEFLSYNYGIRPATLQLQSWSSSGSFCSAVLLIILEHVFGNLDITSLSSRRSLLHTSLSWSMPFYTFSITVHAHVIPISLPARPRGPYGAVWPALCKRGSCLRSTFNAP